VALQLCRALQHAHQKGCIHRDLKPANLYLSEDGFVKLGDLGLARDLNRERLTTQGQTVGTWRYMAPEQITGEENIDGRLDLYATGCMLFEMIAGRVPFDGPDFVTIFDQHLEALPARLDVVTGTCPKPLADLVEQLLHKLPEMRPENAIEVALSLEKILAEDSAEESVAWSDDESTVLASGIPENRPNLTQRLQSGPSAGVVKPL
jgi:serine/threonine protein kinase